MCKHATLACSLTASVCLLLACATHERAAKKTVRSQSDLPRFTYPMVMPASDLVQADPVVFRAFAVRLRADLDTVLRDYDIADKATLRTLLSTKLNLQQIAGEYEDALKTVRQLRELQEKPSARLISRLDTESWLNAAIETKSSSGPLFEQSFTKFYSNKVNQLP